MASKLGSLIRAKRTEQELTLRGLARAIDKSPAFITRLECEEVFPATSPDTLRAIARVLELDLDSLLVSAGRAREVEPKTTLELALYRKVQSLPKKRQQELLDDLNKRGAQAK